MDARPVVMTAAAACAATFCLGASADARWQQLANPRAAKPQTTAQTLERAESAFNHRAGQTDLTPLLARLARALPGLHGAARHRAARLLARPSDGAADPERNGWSAPEAPQSPFCSRHYCVHWVAAGSEAPDLTDANGNGIPDWVETVDGTAENVYAVENGQLGWRPPKSDGVLGGGSGLTDIYLAELGGTGVYGYTAPDPNQRLTRSDHAESAYLVLDNDFAPAQFPGYATPVDPLDVTLAHEYNHVLQFNYDSLQDTWMFESTAVWAEGKVYQPLHDYLQYLPGWAQFTTQPITSFNGKDPNDRRNVKVYGSSVWNKWLEARFDPTVVRAAWEDSLTTSPQSFAPAAYDASIRQHGGHGFADQFDRFAAATAEWQTANSGFPEGSLYPEVQRAGQLQVNGAPGTIRLDHTAYALVDVQGPSAPRIKLAVAAPAGTRAALALIGRSGGSADVHLHELPHGGGGTVVVPARRGFDRLTAALINSDTSQHGFSNSLGDWRYTKDRQRFYTDLSTDFSRPRVRKRIPGRGAETSTRPRVTVTFSERMRGVTSRSLQMVDSRGHHVPVRVQFHDGTRKATLVPRRALRGGRVYQVRLSSAITDLALNPLRRQTSWTFTTR